MKKYKRKAAQLLFVVFSTILLTSFFQSAEAQPEEIQERTVIQKHEISGEAPGNVSRTYVDQAGFEGRFFHEFTFNTIREFHSKLSQISFAQTKLTVEQFKAPVKVYKQIKKFLI